MHRYFALNGLDLTIIIITTCTITTFRRSVCDIIDAAQIVRIADADLDQTANLFIEHDTLAV